MRIVLFVLALGLAAGCSGNGSSADLGTSPDLSAPRVDMATCDVDAAGTPLQICGIPDASFDRALCRCVGDE